MELIKNKKAMYFTVMTALFLVIFLFYFLIPSYQRYSGETGAISSRIKSSNNFVKGLERDIERGLYISSFRALLSLEEHMIKTGQFLTDVNASFNEALLNGTVNGDNVTLMADSRLSDWTKSIQNEGLKLNLYVNITINDAGIYQEDPWNIIAYTNLNITVNDTTGISSWQRNTRSRTSINIIGFEDPLYIIYGLGRVTNTINNTKFENNYTFKVTSEWNLSNLVFHMDNSLYAKNEDAPSFLMRFENNLNPSEYGIESMVNLKKLSDQGFIINSESSIIDYYYWDAEANGDYLINNTLSWVKIDNNHRAKYNVTHLSYPTS